MMLADIEMQNLLTIGGIVLGALVAFLVLRKIVKAVMLLAIVLLIAVAAVIYCVKAGYISREDADKLNPLNSEQVRQAVRDAGSWAGEQAKDAARRAVAAAVDEAVGRTLPTNSPRKR